MDTGYEAYCLADPVFYESPLVVRGDDVDFEVARRPVPEGWTRAEIDDWLAYRPRDARLPPQGWKIHASACLDNAEEILAAVWDYCLARGIAFKFVRSRQLLFLRNAKYADRRASGKFITIYPADEGELAVALRELDEALGGQPGPYILSDLRWGAGPLYVRYGGFAERYCPGLDGELELAIEDPSGRLVPDRRGTAFHPPDWVALPSFLTPHLDARKSGAAPEDFPYLIEEVLHFSNGGGVYAGVDRRSGERVVLKEARPHAGLAVDEADAVARLRREREMLERLDGLDVVPAVRDHLVVAEHHFLVQERVDGSSLSSLLVERYPLTLPELDAGTVADYTAWALDVYGRVEEAVAAVHGRGVVIGDLHPSNVLVRPDGRVVLIDLEVAADVREGRRQTLADPGFVAPPEHTGLDIDRYALACLRLFLFMPLTTLIRIAPSKARYLAAEVAGLFPVPPSFLEEAARVIGRAGAGDRSHELPGQPPDLDPSPAGWRRARESMARAILASATPHRDDRLFPGDVKQFESGGLNLAHGAAGVLYALFATGCGRHPEHEQWLVERTTDPPPGTRLGLYDGLHGVAYALDRLGRRRDALAVLDVCRAELEGRWERLGLGLAGGLAGIGLTLAHFAEATGDRSLWDGVWRVADIVAQRLGDEDDVPEISGGEHPYAGLTRGASGPALMFLRLFERTGDDEFLDLAATALRQDLRRCLLRDDGSLEVNEGWRTMPYLADGSVGIGLVLDDYLAHREDEQLAEAAAAIRKAAESQFYIEPGLFFGRAGMILYLSRRAPAGAAGPDPLVAAHVRRLGWHALTYRGDLAFPGEQLLRLSMDLATGTAGVLLALGAALHEEAVHLPFLGPPRASRAPHAAEPASIRRQE